MCGDALIALLVLADPHQVSERDIKLAIDILANDLGPKQTFHITPTELANEATRKHLLWLLNEHPSLMAISLHDGIVVKKQ